MKRAVCDAFVFQAREILVKIILEVLLKLQKFLKLSKLEDKNYLNFHLYSNLRRDQYVILLGLASLFPSLLLLPPSPLPQVVEEGEESSG